MLLLLDIDGVLVHAESGFREAMLEDTGWSGDDKQFFEDLFANEDYLETLSGALDFEIFIEDFLELHGRPCTVDAFMKWWCHPLTPNLSLIDEVRTISFSKIGLASNQERNRGNAILAGLDAYIAADYVFLSHELGVAKPDQLFFDNILESIAHPSEDVIFIDDSLANVEAARDIGINAVHFKNNDQVLSHLREAIA